METLLLLFADVGPVPAFLILPFVAGLLPALSGIGLQAWLRRRNEHPLTEGAGDWASRQASHLELPVTVRVSAELTGSADGYWPRPGIVGLSPSTWLDRSPVGRVVGAHELGHARTWRDHPVLARILAVARPVHTASTLLAGAAFLVGALMDDPWSIGIGLAALLVSTIAGSGVLVDEALASRTGAEMLHDEGLRTVWTDLAMGLAFAAYALPMVVRAGFLVSPRTFVDGLMTPTSFTMSNTDLGLWAVLFLGPVLALRAAQVILDLRSELPATFEVQLNWALLRERSWDVHAGLIVLTWLFTTYDQPVSAGLSLVFVAAVAPAMPILGALGRTVLFLPFLLAFELAGGFEPPAGRRPVLPAPVEARELLDLDGSPAQRALSLVRISWLPLLFVLYVRAVHGW